MVFKFKKNAKKFCNTGTEDFWDCLFESGGIDIDKILSDKEQLTKVNDAIKTLRQLQEQMEEEGIYEPS